MTGGIWPVADLLPHEGPAVLLDEVVACSETGLSACVTIGSESAFFQSHGVPAHVGLEYMAQACGVFRGISARRAGEAPRVGLILGTRRYVATRAWFTDGVRLVVTSDLVYRDEEVGVFDCVICDDGEAIAKAQLIVAEPNNVAALLGGQGGTDDA